MASPSTISFTMPTSVALIPSAISRVLTESPSSMVTSVGEKDSVGAASSLSTVTVSGEPMVMLPLAGGTCSTRLVGRIVSVTD